MSKRSSIFDQGKPENPYNEREDSPADPPRRATAAQLAGRKLKQARGVRRPPGVTSGIVASPNPFAASQGSGFTFGGDNNNANASTTNLFGNTTSLPTQNGTVFGGTASSFPPSQPSTQNNIFSSSSFPAFGSSDTNTTFNPQPPSSAFNFSVGTGNPFAASAPTSTPASATNGSSNGATTAGSIFNTTGTKQNTPADTNSITQNTTFGAFGGSSTFAQGSPFGTSSAPSKTAFGGSSMAPTSTFGMNSAFSTSNATQNNAFGTTSAPQSSGFGSTSAAPGGLFSANSAPQTNSFGVFSTGAQSSGATITSASQDSASTPSLFPPTMAPTAPFSSAQTPTKTFTFGAVSGPLSSDSATTATPTKTQTVGFSFGATTAASPSIGPATSQTEPSRPIGGFSFPSTVSQETKDEPKGAESGFSFLGASKSEAAKSTPAPSNNLFAGFGAKSTTTQPNTPASSGFKFGSVGSAPTQSSTSASTGFNFGSTSAGAAQSSKPASSGFNFGPTTSGAVQSSTPASTGFKFGSFGASAPLPTVSTPATAKDSSGTEPTAEKAPATTPFSKPVQGLFSGLSSTPQTNTSGLQSEAGSKDTGLQNPFGGIKTNSTSTPQATNGPSLFAMPTGQTPIAFPPASSTPKPAETGTTQTPSLFSKATSMPNQKPTSLFSSVKPSTAAVNEEGQQIGTPKSSSLSNFSRPGQSKVSAPLSPASAMPTLTGTVASPEATTAEASTPKVYVAQNWPASHGTSKDLAELSKQLTLINNSFRTKLVNLSATADWSRLSRWHLNETTAIVKQITEVRKQTAAAKGITGNESSLSVKRKADGEGGRNVREGSPTKKPRANEIPNTPTPKSSSLFSAAPKTAPPASQTANLFGSAINKGSPPRSESSVKEPVTLKPSGHDLTGNTNSAESTKKSLFDSTSQGSGKPGLFKSPFEMPKSHSVSSTPKTGGKVDFMAQFGKASKTAEELRAERKAKDKDADFDSDDETEEEWSARWDKKEEERIAQQKEKLKEQATARPTTETAPSSIFKSTSGTSSPGLFGSRPASPALPNGGGISVFDTPVGATTPTQGNIFGHLSSAPSSNNQDDDEEEDEEEEEEEEGDNESQQQQSAGTGVSKRKPDQSESESEETLEEVLRHKKQDTTKKPALIDRITRVDPSEVDTSESEKEGSKTSTGIFSSQVNGMQTPASKPKHFFDFAAAGAQTAPPKQDAFAGDQTFKPGTPIKFGTATKGQPTFQFQPATPSTSELSTTPSKPPPTTFSFLNAANNQSGLGSGISTRAPTPLSEAESGRDSAVENEDDEAATSEQLDLSSLTEEEKAQYDILFSTPKAVAKHQATKSSGDKVWEAFVNGPLWIVKHKETGRAIVRMRLLSGTMKLNYNILPGTKAAVAGKSRKMVSAMGMKPDGRPTPYYFCLLNPEVAEEFSQIYNENAP